MGDSPRKEKGSWVYHTALCSLPHLYKKKTAQNLFPAQERPSARLTADHCLGWYCRKALTQGDNGKACESAKEIFCILRRLFCIC